MAYRGRRDFGGGFTRAKRLRPCGCDKEQGEQASKKASSSCSTAMGGVGKAGGGGKGERGKGGFFRNVLRHRLLSSSTSRRWLAWHGFSR